MDANTAIGILSTLSGEVRGGRLTNNGTRLNFLCDLGHKSRSAGARLFVDDDGGIGAVCFNDPGHNALLWDTWVRPHWRPPEPGTPEFEIWLDDREARKAARRADCERWDLLRNAVHRSMGHPVPFPSEPPPDNIMAIVRALDSGETATPRTDHLPHWAKEYLAAIQEVAR